MKMPPVSDRELEFMGEKPSSWETWVPGRISSLGKTELDVRRTSPSGPGV